MHIRWLRLLSIAAIFMAAFIGGYAAADDGRVNIHLNDRAFSMLIPPHWQIDAVSQAMISLRPANGDAMIYMAALPTVDYGHGRVGVDTLRSIPRDIEALQKDVPKQRRLNIADVENGAFRVYRKSGVIHIARAHPAALTYSAYTFDPRQGWGITTLVVSGQAKPLYASYVKDLKKIAYSYTVP